MLLKISIAMAINQSQVDHIISSASADDPEVKLQNLQDEVDLLKKSIKKLLIDIRERMNEMENPFIVASMQIDGPTKIPSNEISAEERSESLPIPEQKSAQISSPDEAESRWQPSIQ